MKDINSKVHKLATSLNFEILVSKPPKIFKWFTSKTTLSLVVIDLVALHAECKSHQYKRRKPTFNFS